jgi:hypothetical protein
MIERIFNDLLAWAILGGLAGIFFIVALIFKSRFGDDSSAGTALLRGIEAAILAILGGLIARGFTSLLLGLAHDSAAAGLVVGWGFFLIPGIVDTIPFLTHGQLVLGTPDNLMLFGTVVGALSGAIGGLWQTYDWSGLGWIAFPLDTTWALAGNTVGCLLHTINFAGYWISSIFSDTPWGEHATETRENAHRYDTGFGLRPGFAFTQGCVMSNLSDAPGGDLFRHEKTHVWQNRIFGPLYTLTYIGWIVVWLVPAVIVGIAVEGPVGLGKGPSNWCYFNNPWETWAYLVQKAARTSIEGVTTDDQKMIWSNKIVLAWSIPFFAVSSVLAVIIAVSVWNGPGQAASNPPPHIIHPEPRPGPKPEPKPQPKPAPKPEPKPKAPPHHSVVLPRSRVLFAGVSGERLLDRVTVRLPRAV